MNWPLITFRLRWRYSTQRETLGIAGGIIEPEWCDAEPESWASEFVDGFARRNFGRAPMVASKVDCPSGLPEFSPMGAGMVARRAALEKLGGPR